MRRFSAVALIVGAVWGLAGLAAPAMAADPQVTIVLKDHAFAPAEVPIPAKTKVELLIQNQQPTMAEFESHSLHREKVVQPGGQISVVVGPLDPGRYEFFDDFHNATRGFLVVK